MAIKKSALKKLNSAWKGAKEEFGDSTGGFEDVPTGQYVFHKITAELKESKTSGALMVSRCITVKEGDYAGQKAWDNMNLETERGPEFLLKWLNFMGYQVDDLEKELEEVLEAISANDTCVVKGQIKADEFTNIYMNQILEEGDVGDGEEEGEEEGEEPEAEEEDEESGLDDMTRAELKAYIKENELAVKVLKKDSDDDIRANIEEAEGEPEEAEEEEEEEEEETPVAAKKTAAKKTATKKTATKKGVVSDSAVLKGLKALCTAFGIDFNKEDNLDDFKATFADYTFKRKELDEKEIKALEDADLGKLIKGK